MAFELKDLSGSIYENDRKQKATHPDKTGKCMINGEIYYISGWIKKPEGKKPYISLAFTKAEQKPINEQPNQQDQQELPF
jgi:hypothetical protein